MGRRSWVALLVSIPLLVLGLPPPPTAAITQPNQITYVYDELGRLEAAIDPAATNGIAKYTYDPRGNLVSIGRQSTATTSIVDFHPKIAKRDTSVTVYGAAFSATPSQNTVRFGGSGGTQATVTSATTTQLVVSVPASGAVDGPIYVSSPGGNATSTQQFALDASAAPTITGFTPTTVRWNAAPPPTVTISGTGFDPSSPKANDVFINGISAEVTAATSTSLTATVPPFTTWGKISVRTSAGEATSTQDFVSTQVDPSQLETVTRTTIGTSTTLSLTSGQYSIAMFDANEGDRVFLDVTASTIFFANLAIRDPWGQVLRSGLVGGSVNDPGGGFLDTVTLPVNGTYAVVLDHGGASYTGTLTFTVTTVPPDLSGTLTPGTPTSGTITDKGQNAAYTFSASAGQQATISVTGSTIGFGYIGLRFSDGSQVSQPSPFGSGNTTIGPVTLPLTDTYTLLVDPYSSNLGSFTLTLSLTGGGGGGGAASLSGYPVQPATTAPLEELASSFEPGGTEAWAPVETSRWVSDRPTSPFEGMPPLETRPGATAVAGTVLTLDGAPLEGVTVSIDQETTTTDVTGRFALTGVPVGLQVLEVEGETASGPDATYGRFELSVTIRGGQTTSLGNPIWMPKLDTEHAVQIQSPTTTETIVTSPLVPGLELVIPAGSTITDEDGQPVEEISITPIPIDRPPYPLFTNPTMYFTIQPEGAEILPSGAKLIYPNYQGLTPGRTVPFVTHEADEGGWEQYGYGTVSRDGRTIVPSPDARLRKLTGSGNPFNAFIAAIKQLLNSIKDIVSGDPVDPATGLFAYSKTDLVLPGPMPIELMRYYRPLDFQQSQGGGVPGAPNTYMFGKMMQSSYEGYLYNPDISGTSQTYTQMDLLLGGERPVHYTRTSLGTDFQNAVLQATQTPGPFHKSTIHWDNNWVLTRRDGMTYSFGFAPVLREIRDRFGNRVMVMGPGGSAPNPTSLSFYNPITQIVSYPSGRWINLTYTGGRVTRVSDNLGRKIDYTYSQDQLITVTDPNQVGQPTPKSTTYTWQTRTGCDAPGYTHPVITAVRDPRDITFLQNTYDTNCRITDQVVPASSPNQKFHFDYTLDGQGKVTRTDITDPNENVTRVNYDADGYSTSETYALGTTKERTFSYERASGTHLVNAVVDGFHARRTEYTYNGFGQVASITQLAGTPQTVTTQYTYTSAFKDVDTITDPLNHVTDFDYDAAGCLDRITDGANRDTTFDCNGAGQITSATDARSKTTMLSYSHGDLTTVTDPLGRTISRFTDAGGLVSSVTDPLNYVTRYTYDNLNQLTKITDAAGRDIAFEYDADGNLRFVRDQRGATESTTQFTYNDQNLVQTRVDPLGRTESFTYDDNGNVLTWTDRKNQITEYRYDPFDRVTFAGFNRTGSPPYNYASTIDYTYDVGGRLTQVADSTSGAGTITRGYDDLDRLTSEIQPNAPSPGVLFTYRADGTRQTMTVPGQSQITYGYNNAGQVTSLTQGSTVVSLDYFADGRLQTLTLKPSPTPVTQNYTYDDAGELSQISYTHGASTDDLSYGYDPSGRRTAVWGTYGRITLPAATTSNAVYDLGNRLTSWNGATVVHDNNGNLTSDGTFTYTYNPRNQLTLVKQGNQTRGSNTYDGLGRRVVRTIGNSTTKPAYDGWSLVQERASNGNSVVANYMTGLGLDQPFVRTAGSSTSYYLSDALGSIMGLASSTGTVPTSYTYEPYGKTTVSGTSSASFFGFTGRENDSTGTLSLYNYRFRPYSPGLGRFISEDPLRLPVRPDSNPYVYVGNSPVAFVDPIGLDRSGGFSFGTFTLSYCIIVCVGIGVSSAGIDFFGGFFGLRGVALTWSPGTPSTNVYTSFGACYYLCLGASRDQTTREWSPIIGVTFPPIGGWLGNFGYQRLISF
jgi:RHS repeat-associated protein